MLVDRIKGAFHKSWSALFAFLLPAFLVTLSMVILKMAPFGDETLMFGDANGYYINYISYYKTILSGEHSIFYAFAKGLGSNVYGAAGYDITSPYMLLFMFFSRADYCKCYTFAVILMAALTGLAMERLLNDVYGAKLSNLLFSTAYAMSGFCVVFNYNLLFMTGPLMMPVALLGLRRLLRDEGVILYILAIAYAVATHFQMGFGVCVGVLICFLGIFYVKWKDWEGQRKIVLIRFGLASLAGGLVSGIVWYPTMLSLRGGRAGSLDENDFLFTANKIFYQMASRLYTGASNTDQIIDGFPAIFVGILAVALVILFYISPKVPLRHKQGACGVVVFYLLSFYLRPIKNILQGFTHANWFHFRYSYVFSCVILLIAAEAFSHIKETEIKEITKTASILVLGTIFVFSVEYDFIDGAYAVFDLALIFIMGGLVYCVLKSKNPISDTRVVGALLIVSSIQLVANYVLCNQATLDNWNTNEEEYENDVSVNEDLINTIKNYDDGFYRIENESPRVDHSGNDGMFFDYFGVGYSGNSERDFVADGVADLGLSRRAREITYYNTGTPAAMDSLMGIKYLISGGNIEDEKLYINTGLGNENRSIFENPYALPIAILSDGGISDVHMGEEPDKFLIQNNIWKAMTSGEEDVFIQEDEIVMASSGSSDTIDYSFTADRDGAVYIYDGTGETESYGSDMDILQYVGCFNEGEAVSGSLFIGSENEVDTTYDGQVSRNVYFYYANEDALWDYSQKLKQRDCTVSYVSDTKLEGRVNSGKGQRLFFTIPYDEGWSLYLDGKKVAPKKTLDFLMASPELEEGDHEYELKYTLPGWYVGLGMLAAGLAIMVGMSVFKIVPRKKEESD